MTALNHRVFTWIKKTPNSIDVYSGPLKCNSKASLYLEADIVGEMFIFIVQNH